MKRAPHQSYSARVLRVLVYMQEHLGEPLSIEQLAAVGCFSAFHLNRIFSALVGESIYQHVRRLRLELAAQRLKQTDESITAVALAVGYETHEAFTRAFRTMFDMSPSDFRQAHAPSSFGCTPCGGPAPQVSLVRLVPRRVAFVRHFGAYRDVEAAFEKLFAWAAPRGLLQPGVSIVGIPYDDPAITETARIRYDAALTVPGDVQSEGEIGVRRLAGGDHVVLRHVGPYDELPRSYDALYGRWLPFSGREVADSPVIEIYVNDPETTPPGELITDIHLPLKENRHVR